jgi:hypothetical protein
MRSRMLPKSSWCAKVELTDWAHKRDNLKACDWLGIPPTLSLSLSRGQTSN